MEKRGDITDRTPNAAKPQVKTGQDKGVPRQPASRGEADKIQNHATTRLSDAVADKAKSNG